MSEDEARDPTVAMQMAKWRLFAIVSMLSLIADQATKIWARQTLPVGPVGCKGDLHVVDALMARRCVGTPVSVITDYWDWRLSMNPGSAFGLFSSTGGFGRVMLSIVGVAAVGGMIYMLRKARPDQRILHWALALVAGGAVGNLIDRIYFGVVTDFVLWRYQTKEWPVFNIADVVLVIGVGLMFIDIQKEGKRDKAAKLARQEKAKAQGLVKDLEQR
jgi:signal peptidase II